MTGPALELTGIHKRFGSVHALRGADFTLGRGEVHALLGENGAGKTTLMQVAFGMVRPDAGQVWIAGEVQRNHSTRNARRLGVGMVHQNFTSVAAFTVAENVALAAGWAVVPAAIERRVRDVCDRIGLPLDPGEQAGRLTVGLKQRLEIVKALAADARVLLLDEPTAVLAPAEADELTRVVRRFTARGGSAVLITHKLDEALEGADRITVLRRGAVVGSGPASDWSVEGLTDAMIGGALGLPEAPTGAGSVDRTAPPLVRADGLEIARESGFGIALRLESLEVRAGEIVGIAAVEGSGQRELLRVIAGRLLPLRGRLEVVRPVGFIPEDRTTEGLIPEFTLTENVVLASGPDDVEIAGPYGFHIDWRAARARTAGLLDRYGVVAPGPDAPARALSGGNQQKLIVGRELARGPSVIVAENPTRGLDIRATEEIHRELREAARNGAAVLLHSSDLDEVLALAGRVIVVSRGTVIEAAAGAGRAEIGAMMLAGPR